jgi:hypothetical protein
MHMTMRFQKPRHARRPWASALAIVLSTVAVGGLRTTAHAATPIPTFVAVPATSISQPYGSNDGGIGNLADLGYVQEEFFISGTAQGTTYTTRLLVRRPADPHDFSGVVIAESIRSTASRSMWSLRDYIMRSRHAYVEIGSNITAINNVVKPSDPTRYGSLRMPASMNLPPNTGAVFGHVLEIIAQGGALLKANPAGGPFDRFNVRKVILSGCSEQGLIIRQYLRDAHPLYRGAGGSSIYDGYFPACVADWPSQVIQINGAPFANFTPAAIEVPVINLTGQMEVEAWPQDGRKFRRPDGDAPGDKFRIYEIAGMGHGLSQSATVCAAGQQPSQFKAQYVSNNALDKLIQWVDRGIAPPHGAPLLSASAEGPLLKDAYGNARGGVRSYQVAVPVATYHAGVNLCTWQVPFATATLQSLYPNQAAYLSQANHSLDDLERDGWILKEDAKTAKDLAKTLP